MIGNLFSLIFSVFSFSLFFICCLGTNSTTHPQLIKFQNLFFSVYVPLIYYMFYFQFFCQLKNFDLFLQWIGKNVMKRNDFSFGLLHRHHIDCDCGYPCPYYFWYSSSDLKIYIQCHICSYLNLWPHPLYHILKLYGSW